MITTLMQGAFLNQISHWIHIRFVFMICSLIQIVEHVEKTELSSCRVSSLNNRIAAHMKQVHM